MSDDDRRRSRVPSTNAADRGDSLADRLATISSQIRRGMDRREFLRTVVSAGYAVGLAQLLGVDDFLAAENGHVPVPVALARNPEDESRAVEERTKFVPAEWYAAVSKAFELHRTIADTGVTGYLGSAVVPGSYRSPTATITVDATADTIDQTSSELETIVDEVAVDVEPIEGVDEFERENEEAEDPLLASDIDDGLVPGGVRCANEQVTATLAPALYHSGEQSERFATAYHAFNNFEDPIGEPLLVPLEDGRTVDVGSTIAEYPVADVITAKSDGTYRPDSAIQGATPERVLGQFTRMGLADLAAQGESLEKVGAQTGHTTGSINGIDAITCLTDDTCRRGQLKWGDEGDFTDGDSGSVCYHPDPRNPDEGILVAAFNNARTWWPGQSYIWGTAAYRLWNEHDLHF